MMITANKKRRHSGEGGRQDCGSGKPSAIAKSWCWGEGSNGQIDKHRTVCRAVELLKIIL